MPRYLDSYNVYTGKGDVIRLCCLARAVEESTGEKFVFPIDVPANEVRDWDADQKALRTRREAEIADYDRREAEGNEQTMKEARPTPHVKKLVPGWIAARRERHDRTDR
jgi:hypothetical protein